MIYVIGRSVEVVTDSKGEVEFKFIKKVKIGYASDVERRRAELEAKGALSTGSIIETRLTVLLAFEGDYQLEQWLHNELQCANTINRDLPREWFKMNDLMIAFLESVRSGDDVRRAAEHCGRQLARRAQKTMSKRVRRYEQRTVASANNAPIDSAESAPEGR